MTDNDSIDIKRYIDACVEKTDVKIDAVRDIMQQHFILNDRAVKLAEDALGLRLQSMNEFREQIKEERGQLATKEHLLALTKEFDARLRPLETAKFVSSGQVKLLMTLIAAIPTILALIALFTK